MSRRPPESISVQADNWLARLRSPACTAGDRERFQEWLAQHPAHWQAYNRAEHLWSQAETLRHDAEMMALADGVLARAARRRNSSRRLWALLSAAAAIVLVCAGLFAAFRGGWWGPEPPALVYRTAIGEIRSFALADRSEVTLNTDTVLEVRIGGRRRDLELQRGEAQFKVAHDPQRPFIVTARNAAVTAVGTLFQVRNTDGATEVSLLEGRVRVARTDTKDGAAHARELAPGERVVASTNREGWVRKHLDIDAATGWVSGRLVFDSIPLRQAVDEFNRYSRRKLRIGDPAIGDTAINGIFNAGDTDSISLALQYAYPIRVDDQGEEVVLTRRE